jgi:hypothetical protein
MGIGHDHENRADSIYKYKYNDKIYDNKWEAYKDSPYYDKATDDFSALPPFFLQAQDYLDNTPTGNYGFVNVGPGLLDWYKDSNVGEYDGKPYRDKLEDYEGNYYPIHERPEGYRDERFATPRNSEAMKIMNPSPYWEGRYIDGVDTYAPPSMPLEEWLQMGGTEDEYNMINNLMYGRTDVDADTFPEDESAYHRLYFDKGMKVNTELNPYDPSSKFFPVEKHEAAKLGAQRYVDDEQTAYDITNEPVSFMNILGIYNDNTFPGQVGMDTGNLAAGNVNKLGEFNEKGFFDDSMSTLGHELMHYYQGDYGYEDRNNANNADFHDMVYSLQDMFEPRYMSSFNLVDRGQMEQIKNIHNDSKAINRRDEIERRPNISRPKKDGGLASIML